MSVRVLVALSLLSSTALAQPARQPRPDLGSLATKLEENRKKLTAALATKDPKQLAALFGDVEIRGLWFPTEVCRDAFSKRTKVAKTDDVALAACLFELKLTQPTDSYLFHEPGVSIYPQWSGSKIIGLNAVEIDPASPSIDRAILIKHAKKKLVVKRDTKTIAMLKKDKELIVEADVRLCVDAKGKVDALAVTTPKPDFESYRATVEKTAKKWTFKPFTFDGKAVRVCSTHYFSEYDGDGEIGGVEGGAANDPVPPVPPPVKR